METSAEGKVWNLKQRDISDLEFIMLLRLFCGLYYKLMTIVNDDSRAVNKLDASLTDDARVIIYDRHMFIVQTTDS